MRIFIIYFSLIILAESLWVREEVFADIKTSFKNINHSTERYRRTAFMRKLNQT